MTLQPEQGTIWADALATQGGEAISGALMVAGDFILSLDFELHWGFRDRVSLSACRERLEGVWRAVPAMLDLFSAYEVNATWAVVGMLFAENRDELEAFVPSARPGYHNARLSPYPEIRALGWDENDDPYHFAPSLIRQIAATKGQELGTHTFSHYYCLEPGQRPIEFHADLRAALALAALHGYKLSSLVFPRNQFGLPYLTQLPELGITTFRGTTTRWAHRSSSGADQKRRRLVRLLDSYAPLVAGDVVRSTPVPGITGLVDVPASRFLRPVTPRTRWLMKAQLQRIMSGMQDAAGKGGEYHLWWHPHNFGVHLQENLDLLERVLEQFSELRVRYGMRSQSMGERAETVRLADGIGGTHPGPRPVTPRGARQRDRTSVEA